MATYVGYCIPARTLQEGHYRSQEAQFIQRRASRGRRTQPLSPLQKPLARFTSRYHIPCMLGRPTRQAPNIRNGPADLLLEPV